MEAYGLTGQWSVSGVSPLVFNLDPQPVSASAAAILESSKSFDDRGRMLQANPPAIYISTTASILIVTDGPPRYEPVHGTSLKRLVNTTTTVFKDPTDDEFVRPISFHLTLPGRSP